MSSKDTASQTITLDWQSDGPFVYPLNDLRDHDIENSECWCRPFYDDNILVHNSMDCREFLERRERKPS